MKDALAFGLGGLNLTFGVIVLWLIGTCACHRASRLVSAAFLETVLALAAAAVLWQQAVSRADKAYGMLGALAGFVACHFVIVLVTGSTGPTPFGAIGTKTTKPRLGRAARKELRAARQRTEVERRIAEMERATGVQTPAS